jgi:collagenase-like PrtC family protease
MEIYLSTTLELYNMKQYNNYLSIFDNIKQIVPAFDTNKNFTFLKNLKQKYPNIEVEVMVNEGCLPGCPLRTPHYNCSECFSHNRTKNFSHDFMMRNCYTQYEKEFFLNICKTNIILPWEIEEYSKIGINNFKFVGRDFHGFETGKYFDFYRKYILGIENYDEIKDLPYRFFSDYLIKYENIDFKISDIKDYLPKIEHFVKNGYKCSSVCGVECRYCYDCAEKIKNVLKDTNVSFS